MRQSKVFQLVLGAMFLALTIVLPFLTAQIPEIGSMLLPMHIPVLLCGFVCGWQYGLAVGFIAPLLRSMMYGMPPLFPVAVSMAFEMAVYGAVTGILYKKLPKNMVSVYVSLVGAMLCGRVVWGLLQLVLSGTTGKAFTVPLFIAGAFTNAIPGIILQLVLIPIVVVTLRKARLMK